MSPFALKIELLRPRAWLAANAATLGATIHLDLEEMGASGPARVVHIGPAPPLEAGPGQIVTGTFAHSAANVINLYVEGLDEPIGTTASHPFWCEDRQAFVPAGDLKRGERLRTQDGQLLALTASRPRAAAAVFNLEVNTEHVYYVGIHGLLVHNSCDGKGVAPRAQSRGGRQTALSGRRSEEAVSEVTGIPLNRGAGRQTVPGTGPGGFRIPDLQVFGPNASLAVRGSIIEVKNVTRLSGRLQIRDLAAQARSLGGYLEIFTNAPEPSRGVLRNLIDAGDVVLRPLP